MSTSKDARIGDFSRPVVDAPPASPTKEAFVSAEESLGADARREEAALKPMQSYEERLKEIGVSREKAAQIIDAVLLKGFYAEDVQITKRVKARFRTRSSRDTKRAQEVIEAQRLTYDTHYNELLSRLLLSASLESFGEDKLPHPRKVSSDELEKAFQERVSYIDNMADPALRILMQRLVKFDRMISAILEEGSIENF
jgi:hypothetical protein